MPKGSTTEAKKARKTANPPLKFPRHHRGYIAVEEISHSLNKMKGQFTEKETINRKEEDRGPARKRKIPTGKRKNKCRIRNDRGCWNSA